MVLFSSFIFNTTLYTEFFFNLLKLKSDIAYRFLLTFNHKYLFLPPAAHFNL